MRHVIIGAGPCGVVAAETLRKQDPDSTIILIGNEPIPPYSRMAIPYFLMKDIDEAGTHLRSDDFYDTHNIQYLGHAVENVDTDLKVLTTDDGTEIPYDKLLIAAGSKPLLPPIEGADLPNVHNCWTIEDARQIAERSHSCLEVVLMGAGFIGCIILESLAKMGVNLTVIEMGDRMVPRMLDDKAGGLLEKWCIEKGVNIRTSTRVNSIKEEDDVMIVELDNGETIQACTVISATGVKPNTEFLKGSGIEVDHGIVVNTNMQTNVANVYAAGDVAQGKDFSTGNYEVQAIQPTATDHGRIAALNMAGHLVEHNGSVNMNVLDTLGLISHSFGLWMGVEGGDSVDIYNEEAYKYINLRFGADKEEDVLVGASTLGMTQHIGVIRGLIEGKTHLGVWKSRLMKDPTRLMEAYLSCTQELDNVV
ncbi:NAD(P)/FAD-dependent oxidoreductase [uncultured Cocleimonas sp.]|uniref:NAD(P)/FAD-dependent oxidoreductase n=1 Tax=uncultured Cocleimonas sp. TaxID=1051587 RepID=UPI002610F20F|nr:FAD-dependent oxidoreductase [uncultured Cocleimonas sp.]